jgi:hypothetical protein
MLEEPGRERTEENLDSLSVVCVLKRFEMILAE